LSELGYPIDGSNYFALFAPKGTPKMIVQKIYEAHKKVAEESEGEIRNFYKGFENTLVLLGPEETVKAFQADYRLRKKMIEETGILLK
jgi:tripartite-type tricarboxylate transporter receptor subunit TctC